MTRERTVTLGEALEELDERLDELAAEYREPEAGTDYAGRLEQEAAQTETKLAGVAHLVEEHGEDATVTVAGLTAEMYATVEDTAAAARESRGTDTLPGTVRDIYAAVGLQDAPFLEADELRPGEDELDATLRALGQQPPGVARWIHDLVDDLTTPEGNWTSFAERLQGDSTSET